MLSLTYGLFYQQVQWKEVGEVVPMVSEVVDAVTVTSAAGLPTGPGGTPLYEFRAILGEMASKAGPSN